MRTVTAPLQPFTSGDADARYGRNGGWHPDLHCYRVTAGPQTSPGRGALDGEDSWPAPRPNGGRAAGTMTTTTPRAMTRRARGSRAGSTRKATATATTAAGPRPRQRNTPPGTRLGYAALLAPASHLSAGVLVLAVLAAATGYVLLALARPTRTCPRCKGERVTLTRLRRRIRPCRRCSGTGRAPRLLGPLIHRTYWTIRHERNHRP